MGGDRIGAVNGAASASLQVGAFDAELPIFADIARFRCLVTNASGVATTAPASLQVCRSDLNCDSSTARTT